MTEPRLQESERGGGSRWGCPCGAWWESKDDEPPTNRMCSSTCPKPKLFRLKDKDKDNDE